MRKANPLATCCILCGATQISCTDEWIVFHCVTFCSPDCHDDYRTAEELKTDQRELAAQHRDLSQRDLAAELRDAIGQSKRKKAA